MDRDKRTVVALVERFLDEDVGRGDLTTVATVPRDARGRARIVAKDEAVLAGIEVARTCFEVCGAGAADWGIALEDGSRVAPGEVVLEADTSLRAILTAERTALNLLSRLSGVATMTSSFVTLVEDLPVRVADTRKTTPGLRLLEKYAVTVGGGTNHRFGLDDGILIKDNHIAAAGGINNAVSSAQRHAPHGFRIEVEVATLDELQDALASGADVVLLDNMTPSMVKEGVAIAGGKVLLEVSGGVDHSNLRQYAQTGVDVVSIGAMTHSAPHIDFSLEVMA